MRAARREWIGNGRPRGDDNIWYTRYKSSKREFRKHHIYCSEQYLRRINDEIDAAAEVDSGLFWKLIKKRKGSNVSNTCTELRFRDITYRDPELIANQWGMYFRELYSNAEDPSFDETFKDEIDLEVHYLKQIPNRVYRFDAFLYDELEHEVRSLKINKACGQDGVFNSVQLKCTNSIGDDLVWRCL